MTLNRKPREPEAMNGLVLIVVLVAIAVGVVALYLKARGGAEKSLPYKKASVLFSAAERSFLGVLDTAIAGRYRVFGKVRVADVLSVERMSDRAAWSRAFNKINAKHFDFILCDANDLQVLAAIELDDQTHQQPKRRDRDSFVEAACAAAALPLIRFPAQRTYSVVEVRNAVLTVMGASSNAPAGRHS